MNLEVLGKRVLVRVDKAPEKSTGGLFLPEGARAKLYQGEVLGRGPEANGIQVGSKVLYSPYSGIDVGNGCLIIFSDDVMAIVK